MLPTAIINPPSAKVPPEVTLRLSAILMLPKAVLVPLVFSSSRFPSVKPAAIVLPPASVVNCILPVKNVELVTTVPPPTRLPPTAKVNPPSFTVSPAPMVKSFVIVSVPMAEPTPLNVRVGVPELACKLRDARERDVGTFVMVRLDPILIVTASFVVGAAPVPLQFVDFDQSLSVEPVHVTVPAFATPTNNKATTSNDNLPNQEALGFFEIKFSI